MLVVYTQPNNSFFVFQIHMNFYKMSPRARHPTIEPTNHIAVTTSKELEIPPNQWVEISLGLILITLPKNHIAKITNPHKNYTILTDFWLASCKELTLTIASKNTLHIKPGDTLCHLQLLPITTFLPGNYLPPPPHYKSPLPP